MSHHGHYVEAFTYFDFLVYAFETAGLYALILFLVILTKELWRDLWS